MPDGIPYSPRLKFTPVSLADVADMTGLFAHPGATEAMALGPEMKTPEGALKFVTAIAASNRTQGPVLMFTLRLKEGDRFAGACGLVRMAGSSVAECVYAVVPALQKQGLATEALIALIHNAFEDPAIQEVLAHVHPDNPASVRVMEKSSPETGFVNGGLVNSPNSPDRFLQFRTTREAFLRAQKKP